MFCSFCGKEIAENAKFCVHCGTPVGQPTAAPAEAAYPIPPAAPKKINPLWIILPIVAVIVIAMVVVVLCIFNSPKLKLTRALTKSAAAYTEAADGLDIPDYTDLVMGRAYNNTMDLKLTEADAELFGEIPTGIGLRYEAAGSLPDQDLSMSLTPYYGSVDLLTAQIAFQDDYLYAYAPDILGEGYYAIDTTTVGKDLVASGLANSNLETLGFNIFDLVELVEAHTAPTEEAKKAVIQAAQELLSAVTVEKGTSAELDINGSTMKCSGYLVTIPQEAMEAFLQTLETHTNNVDYEALYREIFSAMGMSEEMFDEALSGLELTENTEAFQEIEALVEDLGDVVLEIYIKGGYVHAAFWEDTVYEEQVALAVYLGGGNTYVNDLSIGVTSGDSTVLLTSHGNHCGAEDTYSDTLVVEMTEYGETCTLLESEFYYYPEKNGTLEWSVTVEDMSLEMAGYLEMEKDSFLLSLDEVSLWQSGSKLLSFSLNYGISEYAPLLTVEEPTFLLPMTLEEQEQFVAKVEDNLMTWAMGLLTQIPELMAALS